MNSGLKFKNIRLEDEVKQEIFIEQPITIEATGDYHAFGAFVSSTAALPRIVTMHDFVVDAALLRMVNQIFLCLIILLKQNLSLYGCG